jgi:hypothetical protein
MTHSPSRLCPSDLRRNVPYKYRALHLWACSPHRVASYPLRVPRTSATLRNPRRGTLPTASDRQGRWKCRAMQEQWPASRSHLAMDTLAVQLTLPLVGCVEDLHLQVSAPCRAHPKKRPVLSHRALSVASVRHESVRLMLTTYLLFALVSLTPLWSTNL